VNDTVSADEVRDMGRIAAQLMPEFVALRDRLSAESPSVRRAVANVFSDWAFDPTADMSLEEKHAYLARLEDEIVRRAKKELICVRAELARRGEAG